MKKNLPLVSIVIPVYNGSNFIGEAIKSAINQTYPNIEILVIDDGSTDYTEKIVKSFGNKVHYYKKKNGGVSSALNFGIDHMKGKYFSWLSHDDIYLPQKIEEEINAIKNPDEPSIVFSNFLLIDELGDTTSETHFENQFESNLFNQNAYPAIRGCVNGDTILIHRDVFKKYGKFDESLETSGDSDLWLRIFPHIKHYFVTTPLVGYRIHPNQDTNKHPHYRSQSDDIAVKKIKYLTPALAKQWGCTLFRLYIDLYIQFKNANLPKATALSYKLAKKNFIESTPTFSIVLSRATKKQIKALANSNYGDFEVFIKNKNIIPDDFRFHNMNGITTIKTSKFIQKSIDKSKGKYILVLSPDIELNVDWVFTKYKKLSQHSNLNNPVIIFESNKTKYSLNEITPLALLRKIHHRLKFNKIRVITKKIINKTSKIAIGCLNGRFTTRNTIFYSTATDDYILKSATSLLSIRKFIPEAKLCILSRNISAKNQSILKANNIDFIDTDLRGYFVRHWQYPTECYYIFAGPELFYEQGFKYSIYIDGDVLCCSNPIKNLSGISGIAGTPIGNCRGVFLDDYEPLKNVFQLNEEQVNRTRIASGVVYFNNKKMNDLKLLQTCSTLFKKCLDNQLPRKGDDSLFTLFQLLYLPTTNIKNLDKKYDFVPNIFGKQPPKNIVFLHFIEYKPWGNYSKESPTIKKYIQKWLSIYALINPKPEKTFIYPINHGTSFYPKEKYNINQLTTPIKTFISENTHLGILNFGDELPKDLIPSIFGYNIRPTTDINKTDLLSVGSVLFELKNITTKRNIYCWGSGFISDKPLEKEVDLIKKISFSAVRGKYTLNRIKKAIPDIDLALGDPGILANLIYPKSQEKNNKIGVVPHYIDADNEIVEKLRKDPRFFIIDPLDPPAKVAYEISSCKYILSSSLHGLIFADSYNIPNAHIIFSDKVYGGEYKFKDYDSTFNKQHLDADINKIFDEKYLKQLFKQYKPIKQLKKYQQNLIDSFPF